MHLSYSALCTLKISNDKSCQEFVTTASRIHPILNWFSNCIGRAEDILACSDSAGPKKLLGRDQTCCQIDMDILSNVVFLILMVFQ